MRLVNLHHIAIAVWDLDRAIAEYTRLYRIEPAWREIIEEQGVEEVMFAIGGSYLQLVGSLGADTAVGRFLERKGEGLHHLAFAVADIEASLALLRSQGARLVDETPRRGGRGSRIAFVHPQALAGTLVELVESQ